MQLFNVNWPKVLREEVITALTEMGGQVRAATHRDRINGFCYYLLDIKELDDMRVKDTIQKVFSRYFSDPSTIKSVCCYTADNFDYITTDTGRITQCSVIRNVTLPPNLVSKVVGAMNKTYTKTIHIQYQTCADFYMYAKDISEFLDTLISVVDFHQLQTGQKLEVFYYYGTQRYKLPYKVHIKQQVSSEYTVKLADLPTTLQEYIVKFLKWHSPEEAKVTTESITVMIPRGKMLKAMAQAYSAYMVDSRDKEDYPITISDASYCLSYCREACVPTTKVSINTFTLPIFNKMTDWLSRENVFSMYTSGVWYIEAAKWKDVNAYLQELKKSEKNLDWVVV